MLDENEPVIPIGNRQLAPVSQATREQLEQFLAWYDKNTDSPAAKQYEVASYTARARLLNIGSTPPPPSVEPPTAAGEPVAVPEGLSHVRDADTITARLKAMAEQFHLVSPATQVDVMPLGFSVSVSTVFVNANPARGEVYPVDGGKLALSGVKLMDIAAAAGVSWDDDRGGRVDDGSDPRYCHYKAVGWVKNFDGTPRRISGQVQIDMRDGSDTVMKGGKGGGPMSPKQVQGVRQHILPHAESKARNRAVASGFGVRRSYDRKELSKPFAIARLVYTGQTDDPELTRQLAVLNAQAALSATNALFGSPPPPLPTPEPPPVKDDKEGGQ